MKVRQEQKHSIKDWAIDDRPREKLLSKSPIALSDSELLAILINTGDVGKSAVEIGKEILELGKNNLIRLGRLTPKDLMKVKGIGQAKAVRIAAALELGRRRQTGSHMEKTAVKGSRDIGSYLQVMLKDYSHEVFGVVYLNRAHKINHFEIISRGGITGTIADPRVILKRALEENATSLVLCHNHPSGNVKPSQADLDLTEKIKMAACYFDIKILDHIIVSDEGYYSFADKGLI